MTNEQVRNKTIKFELTINELEHMFTGLDGLLSGELSLRLLGNDETEIKELKQRVFNKLYKAFNK